MTFGSVFGRTFSPTFQPSSQAAKAAGGWWDLDGTITSCVAAYQPKGAASYAASLADLSGNDNDATEGTAPAWGATDGWKFDGVNDYLKTSVVPGTDQSCSMIIRYSDAVFDDYRWMFGVMVTNVGSFGYGRYKASAPVKFANGGQVTVKVTLPSAAVAAVAGNQGYLDGSTCGGTISGYGTGTMRTIFIGCLHAANDTASSYCQTYVQAVAIYNAVLTSTQVGLLTTAMNAL